MQPARCGDGPSAASRTLHKLESFENALNAYLQTIERFDDGANAIRNIPSISEWTEHCGWEADYTKVLPRAAKKLALRGTTVTKRDLVLNLLRANSPSMNMHLIKNVAMYSASFTTLSATQVLDPSTGMSLAEFGAMLLAMIAADGPLPVGDIIAVVGVVIVGLLLLFGVLKLVDGYLVAGTVQLAIDLGAVNVDNLPKGWTATENNGHIHIRDEKGRIRVRIDPPDKNTPYPHRHHYDESGNSLDTDGNIVEPDSPEAHIPE